MKMLKKLINSCFKRFQKLRIVAYNMLSNRINIIGKPKLNQPLLFLGEGTLKFGKNVNIGYFPSPKFFNTYTHIEAKKKESVIFIDDEVVINNNANIISESIGIRIGKNVLIGADVSILDSDFHDLAPDKRLNGIPKVAPITIEDNVFIGSHVTILKGVTIGKNSVIANGAIVTKDIPDNVIAGGIPAKVIKKLVN